MDMVATMMDCWHAQLRVVAQHFPAAQLRARRDLSSRSNLVGGTFVYVTQTVRRRESACPAHVVQAFRDLGYTIIHIEEPQS